MPNRSAAPHELFWLSCCQDLAPGSQSSSLLVQLRSATLWEQDRVGPAVVLPEVAGFGVHFPTCQATCGRKLPGLLRPCPQGRAVRLVVAWRGSGRRSTRKAPGKPPLNIPRTLSVRKDSNKFGGLGAAAGALKGLAGVFRVRGLPVERTGGMMAIAGTPPRRTSLLNFAPGSAAMGCRC